MNYLIIFLILVGFFSSANAIQYQSPETDEPVNSENSIHLVPEILWDIHEIILDGTIVEYDNNTWTYHIKINQVFKGSLNSDLISAEGFDVWNNFKKGDRALFYLYDISPVSANYKYKITDYSVKTSPVCDARSLIQISPILPNDPNRIVRGHPNIPADWEDPCVPDYFSYDPDFFNFREAIAPLKQIKHKIPIDKIQCKENLYLAYKSSGGAPTCVKLETGKKLLERGFAKCMETKTEHSRVNLCGFHSSVDGNPNQAQETNSHFNSQKIQNKFPNVAQRQVVMKIEDRKLQDGALGVTIIDKITRTEPSDDVVYIEIIKQWENFKIPESMFFNITLEGDDTSVSKPFLIQQSLMESHAGPLKDQFYFSLPINVPLLAKAKQGVILFNYTMPDVLPKDEKYHLKFASFSDVEVELPKNAIIIENNTREYSEFWSYDKDYALTHKAGYLTISYPGNSFDVNSVIIYDITFEIRK